MCRDRTNAGPVHPGKRFGRLTAVRKTDRVDARGERRWWECDCDCGNAIEVRRDLLTEGKARSCGCLWKETRTGNCGGITDLTGRVYGFLTVCWSLSDGRLVCLCECGGMVTVSRNKLHHGDIRSCGCQAVKHQKHPVWAHIPTATGHRRFPTVAAAARFAGINAAQIEKSVHTGKPDANGWFWSRYHQGA